MPRFTKEDVNELNHANYDEVRIHGVRTEAKVLNKNGTYKKNELTNLSADRLHAYPIEQKNGQIGLLLIDKRSPDGGFEFISNSKLINLVPPSERNKPEGHDYILDALKNINKNAVKRNDAGAKIIGDGAGINSIDQIINPSAPQSPPRDDATKKTLKDDLTKLGEGQGRLSRMWNDEKKKTIGGGVGVGAAAVGLLLCVLSAVFPVAAPVLLGIGIPLIIGGLGGAAALGGKAAYNAQQAHKNDAANKAMDIERGLEKGRITEQDIDHAKEKHGNKEKRNEFQKLVSQSRESSTTAKSR